MSTLIGPTRGAFFRAMNAGAAGALASVYPEVPQDVQPSYYKFGSIETDNVSAKPDDHREQLLVEVLAVYRGEDRGQLVAMVDAAHTDLHDKPISAPGAALRKPYFLGATLSDAMPDGVTYVGVMHFSVQAQPA